MAHDISTEERFRYLVESTPDTVVLHADGKLLFVNPAGVRLLAAESAEQLVGRPMSDFAVSQRQTILETLALVEPLPVAPGPLVPPDDPTLHLHLAMEPQEPLPSPQEATA